MQRRAIVFIIIVAIGVSLALLLIGAARISPGLALAGLILVAAIAYLFPSLEQIREYERGVIFRFGKFDRVVNPGLFVIFPSFESIIHVDLRERELDIKPVKLVAKDNVSITVDTVVFVKVTDPKKSVITVKNFEVAMADVVISELRAIVGKMTLEEILEKTENINLILSSNIASVGEQWGIQITRMEVERIILPESLDRSMTLARAAQEYKNKLRTEAEARKIAIEVLDEATKNLGDTTMTYLYLDALKTVGSSKSTKFVLPVELSKFAEILAAKLYAKP
ncbi:hypothetical protein AUJ14_03835 [Candidatus Micrarchaeota archaeon CG1_02_55_22]|nr:MAG: hypothetical protein AUJ14_03835 [Candidatus Micrarchaeota archaeon CG1_02_55_22]